ncbi:MAG: hypothetical protein KGP14_08655 [Betaproteobacteria bacterium]|nr:hypothetical protein [Betaproteobacteria bacterium]
MIRSILLLVTLAISGAGIAADQAINYSDFQQGFMQAIAEYSGKYKKAENELQKSALVTERFQRFTKLKGDPKHIKDWIGVVETMGTNGDGKAYATIRLSPNLLTVSTWNNAFSDASDHSLIPQSSPVFKKLALMKPGNVVKFSGRLKHAKNMTEEGKMLTPDFLFIFTDIEKIGERAQP